MTEKSFGALQEEIVHKLTECFNSSRSDILKVKPVVDEWFRQMQHLRELRDPIKLRNFILKSLDLSEAPDSNVHESTREALVKSFEHLFHCYLEFIPYDNFTKAADIIQAIQKQPLNTYESVNEFLKLRSELSDRLNDHRNERCQRIQERISALFKTIRAKLKESPQEDSAVGETDLGIREIHESIALYNSFSPNSEDLGAVAVMRYNINVTNGDILDLKQGKAVGSHLVDFLGMYLNERGENNLLFLKSQLAHLLSEEGDVKGEDWEIQRVSRLHEASGGFIKHLDGKIWKDYERVCVPYRNHEGEWSLYYFENEGRTQWIVEFRKEAGGEHKAHELGKRIRRYLVDHGSEHHDDEEHHVKRVVYTNESGNNTGRLVLFMMHRIYEHHSGHLEEGEHKIHEGVGEFSQRYFGTLANIGINSEGYLKFDELL